MSTCLVLGASGYVGALLVEALAAAGHRVRALSRGIEHAPAGVVVVRADVRDADALREAMDGADVVYHLVHSMVATGFARADEEIAYAVADEAFRAGVRQLVYLGGPRPWDGEVSDHLASRARVGDIFLDSPTPALVLQASMVIGAGSASFTLLTRAARGGPVLPSPAYMANRSRPIAIDDVLHYLVEAAEAEPVDWVADIGGPEVVTYLELVQRCARVLGLPRRLSVPVPEVPIALAAAVSPLPEPLVRALLDSLRHDLVPTSVLPPPPGGSTSLDCAMRSALGVPVPVGPPDDVAVLCDHRRLRVRAGRRALWRVITDIGGDAGWHTLPGAWALRGCVDHLLGGVGLHRGRPARLTPGDVVDSWSVVDRSDADRTLVLRTDMRLPGRAWLTLRAVEGERPGESGYEQTVTFAPDGMLGKLYWYSQKPAHELVFGLMAQGVAWSAERSLSPRRPAR
ncbi:DUF2867 domain-containing protein [Actinokineospora enzanensis]|uniref:DUF2867 domain-containing protein n=1 Tax=Actinokineospora enzanensis TaxID=155975 RepID=UPI00036CE44F|nr:DUF2867 domain-containing protein [Actinokineospora enzanensis]